MEQTWRRFEPGDRVTVRDARRAGADGIVTALHEPPPGSTWPLEHIRERQAEIHGVGLRWTVVESLDVSERIKTRAPGCQDDVAAFQQSIRNLAASGLRIVAWNLMPLFSWMRTHLHVPAPTGGFATHFDALAFAAFDDPPWPLLGLPRNVSTSADLDPLRHESPESSNAITFCTGALGVRSDNDLLAMLRRFTSRITDLIRLIPELVKQERCRTQTGNDMRPLPFRADHGQQLLDDRERGAHPGYPAVSRLRGLTELRGAIRAAERLFAEDCLA